MFNEVVQQAHQAMKELLEQAGLKPGSLMVVGCSSSEIVGKRIGKGSNIEAAEALCSGIWPLLKQNGITLAAQCCEHLNRALVVSRDVAEARGYEVVNAVPSPEAGGSFATVVYRGFRDPVLVGQVLAEAGMDIGGTLIGMHLRQVAVPVRLSLDMIGQAHILCARTRPKYIGGQRTTYLEM